MPGHGSNLWQDTGIPAADGRLIVGMVSLRWVTGCHCLCAALQTARTQRVGPKLLMLRTGLTCCEWFCFHNMLRRHRAEFIFLKALYLIIIAEVDSTKPSLTSNYSDQGFNLASNGHLCPLVSLGTMTTTLESMGGHNNNNAFTFLYLRGWSAWRL